MARNILADVLALRDTLGVNPMHMGFIGSSDTHNGDPGDVSEHGYPGHGGILDNDPRTQLGYWVCDGKNEDPNDPAHCTNRKFMDRARGFNPGGLAGVWAPENTRQRSEEHTSELQSLMRNSYAVFCLKKKKDKYKHHHYNKTI